MPFVVVCWVSPGMRTVDGSADCTSGRGSFHNRYRAAIVTNGEFVALLCENV